jgi:hypothetical protein
MNPATPVISQVFGSAINSSRKYGYWPAEEMVHIQGGIISQAEASSIPRLAVTACELSHFWAGSYVVDATEFL